MPTPPGSVDYSAAYPGMPGVAPNDLTTVGRRLGMLPITQYFDPRIAAVQAVASPLRLYDRENDGVFWDAEVATASPTVATLGANAKPALSFVTGSTGRGLRASGATTHTAVAIIAAFTVTTAQLAVSAGYRDLISKKVAGSQFFGVQLAGAGITGGLAGHLVFNTQNAAGNDSHDLGAIAAGDHILCASLGSDGTWAAYIDNPTTPVASGSGLSPVPITGRWVIGNFDTPSNSDGWESVIGLLPICENSVLHGPTDYVSALRASGMKAVAIEYGIGLTG